VVEKPIPDSSADAAKVRFVRVSIVETDRSEGAA